MIMRTAVALISGLLFGIGLTLSQMINPAKVLAFLDIAGAWDPSLVFVMIGALIVAAPAHAIAGKRTRPFYGGNFAIPTRRDIDKSLIIGAVLFGAGWGMAGYCPGPAIAGLTFGLWQPWSFVAAMLAGMAIHRLTNRA
jgi:uncharacterized membrane protein YedE/YeeE